MKASFSDKAAIAMGANVASLYGTPQQTMRAALTHLANDSVKISSVSGFYATPCFPPGAGPDYVNAAVMVETKYSATELLNHVHHVEAYFGRERVQRWASRTLDMDLLFLGSQVAPDLAGFQEWHDLDPGLQATRAPDKLILPHPRIQDRAFVLVPLAEIAPDWSHPVSGLTVSQMLEALSEKDRAEISLLPG
ncbi:2-amino-4-hydroxy-6-hydroxymethyldihydropteridine pyrophosphokinase [Actibacterium mucosum KCTC 23349]|uniref:2-amino-4-hydroxy-6-hydroxymethyldihydropteridine pyrophosphokinase n=1 Tax=Actibacterium mucosum KCTC 23349 TaxID=1454373 RepID=A0A037ZMU5_9RHOB|nr:2-amino-4-hydroxy-6-hydroxymethyldihydropteridine pyrophosphokinase [Actibacterium mucosum KCTC 23349]